LYHFPHCTCLLRKFANRRAAPVRGSPGSVCPSFSWLPVIDLAPGRLPPIHCTAVPVPPPEPIPQWPWWITKLAFQNLSQQIQPFTIHKSYPPLLSKGLLDFCLQRLQRCNLKLAHFDILYQDYCIQEYSWCIKKERKVLYIKTSRKLVLADCILAVRRLETLPVIGPAHW